MNGALWTIKIEAGFYIVLPLVVFWLSKCKSKKNQNILLIVFYILSITWNEVFLLLSKKFGIKLLSDLAHQFPGFVSFFASGMIFLYNYDFFRKHENKFIIPAVVVFAFHYITHTEFLMPIALTIIVMWLGFHLVLFKNIGRTCDYSYGMYLTHFPIMQMCVLLGFFDKLPFFGIFLVIAASFLCSYLLNIWEKNWKCKLLKKDNKDIII